jgi:ubiquinone/menaquinone biosynthesis C-methylase UbiE
LRWEFFDLSRRRFAGERRVVDQTEVRVAAGTGRNLRHYPDPVNLTGIEFRPAMLEIARNAAADLGPTVDLRVGDAQALEFPDESFDTVVCTLALCTIPDDRAAVSEAKRVLRPGGRFLLLEHVRSPNRAIRRGQQLLEPLAVRFEGDHLLREPLDQSHRDAAASYTRRLL